MDLLQYLGPAFEPYITVHRVHPSATYNYKARGLFGLPVFEVSMHAPKCAPGTSWVYVAVPAGQRLDSLGSSDRLYVGSQLGDRMFRGDGMRGSNFHHAQMRSGNGADTPEAFLRQGRQIEILRLGVHQLGDAVRSAAPLRSFAPLLGEAHPGYWFEQLILLHEKPLWRWNTAPAESRAAARLRSMEW